MTAPASLGGDLTGASPVQRLGQVRAFDGLRGIALILIMGYHMGWPLIQGTSIALYSFFALSGFLITTLLLEERLVTGRISYPQFLLRRALRLLPALALVLVVVTAWCLALDPPKARATLHSTASVVLYYANWRATLSGIQSLGYYDHMWSLTVEEQFYFAWAIVLLVTLRPGVRLTARRLRGLAWGAVAASALVLVDRVVIWTTSHDSGRAFYGSDAIADQVLLGCAAGILVFTARQTGGGGLARTGRVLRVAVWPAIAVELAWLFGVVDLSDAVGAGWVVTLGQTVTALSGAVLISYLVLAPGSRVARATTVGPFPWLGTTSYAIYLWHIPIQGLLVAALHLSRGPRLWVLALPLQILVGALTNRWLERPALRLKRRLSRQARPPSAAATTAATTATTPASTALQ